MGTDGSTRLRLYFQSSFRMFRATLTESMRSVVCSPALPAISLVAIFLLVWPITGLDSSA